MPRWTSNAWFLTGPTASGKSQIALALAEALDAEIVAMDSMTLYRGMDIGTAKPTPADRCRVPHHLIDVLMPWESASVDWYLREAERCCAAIVARGKQPLFVGGTPLYLKALLRGLFPGPGADPAFRAELEQEAAAQGSTVLHARLAEVDPQAAARIHPGDTRRIVRALEVFRATGRPISEWQREFDRPADPPPKVACLLRPRQELYARIDQRVVDMLEGGWIDEVRRLRERDRRPSREALQAVGIAEIAKYLDGSVSYAEMVDRIQTQTRQFCKRQLTWFRHLEEVRVFPTGQDEPVERLLDRLREFFTTAGTPESPSLSAGERPQ